MSAKILIYKGIRFDNFETEEEPLNETYTKKNYWSDICTECREKYADNLGDGEYEFSGDGGWGMCGVEGCNNSHENGVDTEYIDFHPVFVKIIETDGAYDGGGRDDGNEM